MDTTMDATMDATTGAAATDEPPTTATWSFVQMNMSLLPIARPLPVAAAACPRRLLHDALELRKPRTPTQRLHRRVLQSAANISPRRHDVHSSTSSTSAAFSAPTTSPPASAARVRCQSEERVARRDADACGYASDSKDPGTYKGKRILELLDEERRLRPDECSAPSPSKRSRQQR